MEAGKVKEIGKMNGEKHMPEKGSLPCLLSMLTGFIKINKNNNKNNYSLHFLIVVSLAVERSSISKEFQDR